MTKELQKMTNLSSRNQKIFASLIYKNTKAQILTLND